MSTWERSRVTQRQLDGLVRDSSLSPLTEAEEWKIPGVEDYPRPPRGYVVSFTAFHERGFSVPAGRFIRAVLNEYELELQHINPNGVQQMAVFVALCEGYLGMEAHWDLFRYFFKFVLHAAEGGVPATLGCAVLKAKQGRSKDYIPGTTLISSNKGWHPGWFYLKNDPKNPLPEYTGRSFEKAPDHWGYGPEKKLQEKLLGDIWKALARLRDANVSAAEVIGGYLSRLVGRIGDSSEAENSSGESETRRVTSELPGHGGSA